MSYQYIFDIEIVGLCDVIHNKGVKWSFHYLGNVNVHTKTKIFFFKIRFENKFYNIYFRV